MNRILWPCRPLALRLSSIQYHTPSTISCCWWEHSLCTPPQSHNRILLSCYPISAKTHHHGHKTPMLNILKDNLWVVGSKFAEENWWVCWVTPYWWIIFFLFLFRSSSVILLLCRFYSLWRSNRHSFYANLSHGYQHHRILKFSTSPCGTG